MAKMMSKFLTLLGFEERPGDDDAPQEVQEPAAPSPYGANPYKSTGAGNTGRTPVRRRMEDGAATGGTASVPTAAMPRRNEESRVVPMSQSGASGSMRMVVYQPQSYDDTQRIIDDLKSGRPVIANLEDLNVEIAQRVLDFLSGAVYGVDGSIRKISRGIFVLAPQHVDISGNVLGNITSDLRSGRSSYFSLPRRPE